MKKFSIRFNFLELTIKNDFFQSISFSSLNNFLTFPFISLVSISRLHLKIVKNNKMNYSIKNFNLYSVGVSCPEKNFPTLWKKSNKKLIWFENKKFSLTPNFFFLKQFTARIPQPFHTRNTTPQRLKLATKWTTHCSTFVTRGISRGVSPLPNVSSTTGPCNGLVQKLSAIVSNK